MVMKEKDITEFLYSLDTTKFKERKYREWVSAQLPPYFKWTLCCEIHYFDCNIEDLEGFEKNFNLDLNINSDLVITGVNSVLYRGVRAFTSVLPQDFSEDREIHIHETFPSILNDPSIDVQGQIDTFYALYDSRHFVPKIEGIRKSKVEFYNVVTKFYLKNRELSDILYPIITSLLFKHCYRPKDYLYSINYNFSNTVFKNPLSLSKLKMGDVWSTEEMFKNCSFPVDFSFGEWREPQICEFEGGDKFFNYTDSMFEGCTFPDNFCMGFTSKKRISYYNNRMFANCKFGKNFRFKPYSITFDSDDTRIVEFFSGSVIPEDFSLKDQFVFDSHDGYKYIKPSSNLINLFKGCNFTGNLKLKVDKILANPNLKNKDKDIEILKLLINDKDWSIEKPQLDSCSEELKKLIKKGYTLQQCICSLMSKGDYSEEQIIQSYDKIHGILFSNCLKSVPKYLFKTSNTGDSLTVGQAREALIAKGYPKNIVDEAIIEYLKDQILV